MHYQCEIIIPPTDDYKKAVQEIMEPFSENNDTDEALISFWDFYVIGGRYSGVKLEKILGQENINKFTEKLNELKVTVSGLQCGKQELSPLSQSETVDALWRDMFPSSGVAKCPLFAHSNNQYDSDSLIKYDVCALKETPKNMECGRVIIGTDQGYNDTWKAEYMCSDSIWNGVTHEETSWDQTIGGALEQVSKKFSNYKEEYREKRTPKDDWLVITVDYHS